MLEAVIETAIYIQRRENQSCFIKDSLIPSNPVRTPVARFDVRSGYRNSYIDTGKGKSQSYFIKDSLIPSNPVRATVA